MNTAFRMGKCHTWRMFKSKGATLTLVWLFSCSLLMGYILLCNCFIGADPYLNSGLFFVAMILVFPIAGLLADVYYGRYKVLKVSIWIVWGGGILSLLAMTVEKMLPHHRSFKALQILFFIVMLVGLGGFLANIIQFGIDQFVDASSMKLSSYINWCTWVFYLGVAVHLASRACIYGIYQLVSKYLVPFFLTVTLCSDFFCSHWLIKEPTGLNPLKLMYKVLRYAVKNKFPQQRSAFTYWDDKRYSRIDLAKSKFGGPFTTEQVEDVKTFFRMIILILVVSFSVVMCFEIRFLNVILFSHHISEESFCIGQCYKHILVNYFDYLQMVLIIPPFEFLLYPLLSSMLPRLTAAITITRKFVVSVSFLLLCNTALFLLQISNSKSGSESDCFLFANSTTLQPANTLSSISFWWLVIPKVFAGIAFYILLTGFLEFVCAQCPYSMKGFLLGIVYGIVSLSAVLSYLVGYVIQWILRRVNFEDAAYDCGIWYLAILVVVNILLLFLTSGVVWWYPLRRRDENIHNEHMFAVNYYDRYIEIDTEHSLSACEDD